MTQPSNRLPRIFPWFFVLIGVVAVGCGVWNLYRSLLSERWPATQAVIQTAGMQSQSGGHNSGRTYSAHITYGYQVAGSSYTGDRVAFGSMSSSVNSAQAILNRYPVGKKIPVYYDPNDPKLAVLETGIHGGTWLCFVVGTIFVLAGGMVLQIINAALRAQATGEGVPRQMPAQQPPALMGVIFVVMGSFVFFMEPSKGVANWVGYAGGGMFILSGLGMLACRLQNKLFSKMLFGAAVIAFLAIFHWVSFAPGQRLGTTTTPISVTHGSNVKPFFAAFTILVDFLLCFSALRWLAKRRYR